LDEEPEEDESEEGGEGERCAGCLSPGEEVEEED